MNYEALSSFAQTWGMLYFVLIFAAVLVYAFWPKNAEKFQQAAKLPMSEKDTGDDRPLA